MNQVNHSEEPLGTVLEIQRMSTEDGPGIRTTVFFKGCTLKCTWCHNPESISPKPQIHWIGSRCIGCQTCRDICPNGALFHEPEGIRIDRSLCQGCGTCAEECPSTALELMGKVWTVDALVGEVNKDRAYFKKSGGGVTASGGEAAMQAEFVAAFLSGCREKGLHTAIDTCGHYSRKALDAILPHVDMVLFDLKEIDPERHKAFTGHGHERIHQSLCFIAEWMKTHPLPRELWIRTPIVPGATDTRENIRGIGRFIAANLGRTVIRWELCAFNNLCRDKYLRLDLDWPFKDSGLMSAEKMDALADEARKSGVDPNIVHWTGATSVEDDTVEEESPRLHLVKSACPA